MTESNQTSPAAIIAAVTPYAQALAGEVAGARTVLRRRIHWRRDTDTRLARLDSRIDALFEAMRAASQAAGISLDEDTGHGYDAAALIQARRAGMHLVRTGTEASK